MISALMRIQALTFKLYFNDILYSGLTQTRLKHQMSQEYNNLVKQEKDGNDSCRTLLEDQDYSDRNSFKGNSGMKRINHIFSY